MAHGRVVVHHLLLCVRIHMRTGRVRVQRRVVGVTLSVAISNLNLTHSVQVLSRLNVEEMHVVHGRFARIIKGSKISDT